MTKKELQERIDYLENRIDDLSSENRKYRDKEEANQFQVLEDKKLLVEINKDYLEIIRWHVNPKSAMPPQRDMDRLTSY